MIQATERQIEVSILQLLTYSGYYCYRNRDQAKKIGNSYRSDPWEFRGQSDLEVFVQGRVIFLEVKTPKGRQSQHQKDYQAQCDKHNIPYHIVTSAKQALEIVTALDSGRSKIDSKRL